MLVVKLSIVQSTIVQLRIVQSIVQVKVQWTEQLVATQKQKTEQIKKETEKLNALADADRQKAVLQVGLKGARGGAGAGAGAY